MPRELLRVMYVDDLLHLWSAEKRLVVPMSRMARTATSPFLRQILINHARLIDFHAQRLEWMCEGLGVRARDRTRRCAGMDGLIAQAYTVMSGEYREDVLDAALAATAQRITLYKVVRYGTARSRAAQLGYRDQVSLLDNTQSEETIVLETLEAMGEALAGPYAAATSDRSSSFDLTISSDSTSQHRRDDGAIDFAETGQG